MLRRTAIFVWVVVVIGLLLGGQGAQAQTQEWDDNAPQFLYRNGENLILVNAFTGEAEILQGVRVGEYDKVEWSSGGQYLAISTPDDPTDFVYHYCLNVYNISERKMLYNHSLDCEIRAVGFSHDGTRLIYANRPDNSPNEVLWLHTFSSMITKQIYETIDGNPVNAAGISDIRWSPTDNYVSFIEYYQIMGGTVNRLHLLNTRTNKAYDVPTPVDGYYASYRPIWSPYDDWFLLDLQQHAVTSGAIPFTNDEGDIYLVRSETGEVRRLTFTPTEYEQNIRWVEDGWIAYDMSQSVTLTISDALQIKAPPADTIIQPLPILDPPSRCHSQTRTNDLRFVAELCPLEISDEENGYATAELDIRSDQISGGFVSSRGIYSALLSGNTKDSSHVVVGWRPSQQ